LTCADSLLNAGPHVAIDCIFKKMAERK
jgi:hypothetical protein